MAALAVRLADERGIPRELPLGCGIAESGLRTDARRPVNAVDDERHWPDVSMGWGQQTVAWSDEYHAQGGNPAVYPGARVVDEIGNLYYDPEYAGRVMADKLAAYYRDFIGRGYSQDDAVFAAMCKYNWSAGDGRPANEANAANYRAGIARARAWLQAHP